MVHSYFAKLKTEHMDRDSLTTRLRTSLLAAILIGALAWYTKWPTLRAGLLILLLGRSPWR